MSKLVSCWNDHCWHEQGCLCLCANHHQYGASWWATIYIFPPERHWFMMQTLSSAIMAPRCYPPPYPESTGGVTPPFHWPQVFPAFQQCSVSFVRGRTRMQEVSNTRFDKTTEYNRVAKAVLCPHTGLPWRSPPTASCPPLHKPLCSEVAQSHSGIASLCFNFAPL